MEELNSIYEKIQIVNGEDFFGQELRHKKSGARIVILKNDSKEFDFSIAFKTPSYDDSGIAHILEHCIVKGIDTLIYKNKSVYFNAETFVDKTIFEFAQNDGLFFDKYIFEILEKVFFPPVCYNKNIFSVEGWRIHNVSDNKHDIYTGVVYNEMKNILSSPFWLMARKIPYSLFKDTRYGKISGGIPSEIIKVTYDKLINYHKKYYNPSNCFIYLYGNSDFSEILKQIDKVFEKINFEAIEAEDEDMVINRRLVEEKISYPVLKSKKKDNKYFMSVNFETKKPKVLEEYIIYKFFVYIMRRKCIELSTTGMRLDSNKQVFTIFNNSAYRTYFSFVLANCNENDKESFINLCSMVIRNLALDNKIHDELIAYIGNNSFLKMMSKKNVPKSITYNNLIMENWMYNGNPFSYLKYNNALEKINSMDAEKIIKFLKENFMDNTAKSILILEPEYNVYNQYDNYELKINHDHGRVDDEEGVKLSNRIQIEFSKIANKQLEKFRILSSGSRGNIISITKEYIDDVMTFIYINELDDKCYVNLYFDLSNIRETLLNYVPLVQYALLICKSGEKYGVSLYDKAVDNGISIKVELSVFDNYDNYNLVFPKLIIKGSAFPKKIDILFEVIHDLINMQFSCNRNLIKQLVERIKLNFEQNLIRNIDAIVSRRLGTYSSKKSIYEDAFFGVSMYKFICMISINLEQNLDMIIDNMQRVAELIFKRKDLIVSNYTKESEAIVMRQKLKEFYKSIRKSVIESYSEIKEPIRGNEAFIIPADTLYIAQGYNHKKLGFRMNEKINVFCQYLNTNYLFNEVRNKNGAYECNIKNWRGDTIVFFSYKDSKLKAALNIFGESSTFLKKNLINNDQIAVFKSNVIKELIHLNDFNIPFDINTKHYIKQAPDRYIEKSINEILDMNNKDLDQFIELIDAVINKENYCVFGGEEILMDNKEYFKSIDYLLE